MSTKPEKYIFHEPSEYKFRDVNGHHGKTFSTNSAKTGHMIIECDNKLTVSLVQNKSEFNYYIIEGAGYFVVNDIKQSVKQGDLAVLPPGTKYTFGGQLKMLLINTPHYTPEQEQILDV